MSDNPLPPAVEVSQDAMEAVAELNRGQGEEPGDAVATAGPADRAVLPSMLARLGLGTPGVPAVPAETPVGYWRREAARVDGTHRELLDRLRAHQRETSDALADWLRSARESRDADGEGRAADAIVQQQRVFDCCVRAVESDQFRRRLAEWWQKECEILQHAVEELRRDVDERRFAMDGGWQQEAFQRLQQAQVANPFSPVLEEAGAIAADLLRDMGDLLAAAPPADAAVTELPARVDLRGIVGGILADQLAPVIFQQTLITDLWRRVDQSMLGGTIRLGSRQRTNQDTVTQQLLIMASTEQDFVWTAKKATVAKRLGCDPRTLKSNKTWQQFERKRAKGGKPKAVTFTEKIEATVGKRPAAPVEMAGGDDEPLDSNADQELQSLIEEQRRDQEPSPLDPGNPGRPRKVKHRKSV